MLILKLREVESMKSYTDEEVLTMVESEKKYGMITICNQLNFL